MKTYAVLSLEDILDGTRRVSNVLFGAADGTVLDLVALLQSLLAS